MREFTYLPTSVRADSIEEVSTATEIVEIKSVVAEVDRRGLLVESLGHEEKIEESRLLDYGGLANIDEFPVAWEPKTFFGNMHMRWADHGKRRFLPS